MNNYNSLRLSIRRTLNFYPNNSFFILLKPQGPSDPSQKEGK